MTDAPDDRGWVRLHWTTVAIVVVALAAQLVEEVVAHRLIQTQRRAIEHQADVIHEMLPDGDGRLARDEVGAT